MCCAEGKGGVWWGEVVGWGGGGGGVRWRFGGGGGGGPLCRRHQSDRNYRVCKYIFITYVYVYFLASIDELQTDRELNNLVQGTSTIFR